MSIIRIINKLINKQFRFNRQYILHYDNICITHHPVLESADTEQVSCDLYASHLNISRQRSGLDSSYGSSESLDQIILEYDHVSFS